MTNLAGILMMVGANAFFAVGDALVKVNSAVLAPGQIIVLLALGGLAIYLVAARIRGERVWSRAFFAPPVIGRNLSEIVGTFAMITALSLAPLTVVAAILQTSPLITTMLAALILKEAVGWRRWLAVAIGFAGMLLIVRPGSADFDPNVLFAVLGTLALSARDIFTRLSPRDLPTTALASYGVVAILPPGILLVLLTPGPIVPDGVMWPSVLAMIAFGGAGYFLITLALRAGEVSVIAPFRYSRLVFAMILGILFLGEQPDTATLAGAALILAAGIYGFWRERKRRSHLHSGEPAR